MRLATDALSRNDDQKERKKKEDQLYLVGPREERAAA